MGKVSDSVIRSTVARTMYDIYGSRETAQCSRIRSTLRLYGTRPSSISFTTSQFLKHVDRRASANLFGLTMLNASSVDGKDQDVISSPLRRDAGCE